MTRPLTWCEFDPLQLKTVADRQFEVCTRSEQSSNSHQTRYRQDLSCLVWQCELSRPDRQTSAFSVGVCRMAHAFCRCDRRTHSDAERTCRVDSVHTATPETTRLSRLLSTAAAATEARQAAIRLAARPPTRSHVVRHAKCKHAVGCCI